MTFEEAFRRINGRAPSDTEVKDALALSDVLKQADLDPMLLMYLADVKAKDERERMVLEMRSIASETVNTIRAGLPTNPEWAKAAAWATTLVRATKTQLLWVLIAVTIALSLGVFGGEQLTFAITDRNNHAAVCADLSQHLNAFAIYAEHNLRSRALAERVRGTSWKDCP